MEETIGDQAVHLPDSRGLRTDKRSLLGRFSSHWNSPPPSENAMNSMVQGNANPHMTQASTWYTRILSSSTPSVEVDS